MCIILNIWDQNCFWLWIVFSDLGIWTISIHISQGYKHKSALCLVISLYTEPKANFSFCCFYLPEIQTNRKQEGEGRRDCGGGVREKDLPFTVSFSQMLVKAMSEPGWNQEPEIQCRSPTWVTDMKCSSYHLLPSRGCRNRKVEVDQDSHPGSLTWGACIPSCVEQPRPKDNAVIFFSNPVHERSGVEFSTPSITLTLKC